MAELVKSKIDMIVARTPGWTPADQLAMLFELVCKTGDIEGDIVEVGSWCGRSASVLGLAAKILGNTNLYCIDLFPEKDDWQINKDGTYSFRVTIDGKDYFGCRNQTVWSDVFKRDIAPIYGKYGTVFDAFSSTIIYEGVDDIVRPFRGDSSSFVNLMRGRLFCKLAFIDGEHSYEAVSADIRNLEDILVPGAWLCFDDAFTVYDGVSRAIQELIIESGNYEHCEQLTRKLFAARKLLR